MENRLRKHSLRLTLGVFVAAFLSQVTAHEVPSQINEMRMTAEKLAEIVKNVDANMQQDGNSLYFHIDELEGAVIYDVAADRMRIIMPIGPVEELIADDLQRMMQANFDSALDARYAIAQGTLWGVFIHPLSTLKEDEFLVGLGQTANVVLTYGTSYSSGMFVYGNGDSGEIERRRLIERLKELGT